MDAIFHFIGVEHQLIIDLPSKDIHDANLNMNQT